MKRTVYLLLLLAGAGVSNAQKQTYDIATFTVPRGWKAEPKENLLLFSRIDGGSWAQIGVYKSTVSKGSAEEDAISEWQTLVASQHAMSQEESTKPQSGDGWEVMSKSGVWQFNGSNVATILTTYSNRQVCFSVLLNATAKPYLEMYQDFIGTLTPSLPAGNTKGHDLGPDNIQRKPGGVAGNDLGPDNIQRKPGGVAGNDLGLDNIQRKPGGLASNDLGPDNIQRKPGGVAGNDLGPDNIQRTSGFKFTTTNWDDGWVSHVKENWVEVVKPGIKVLVHYPNQQVDAYSAEKLQGDRNAWDKLIEPRYSTLSNVQERGIQDYESVTFFTADGREKATGKIVYVVLFKKHDDKGGGRYLEAVADSRAVFEQEFGSNYINRSSWEYMDQVKSWDKLANMQNRNKFSITAGDLIGKWSASDYASLRYYYVSTGGFAGATATSISDEFTFLPGNTYQSDHAGASGVVGNQQFSRQVYKGNSLVTEWSITLTNRFKGQSEKYNSYFEAVKGGRILVLTDRNNSVKCLVKQPG